jgi:hypothetical protein
MSGPTGWIVDLLGEYWRILFLRDYWYIDDEWTYWANSGPTGWILENTVSPWILDLLGEYWTYWVNTGEYYFSLFFFCSSCFHYVPLFVFYSLALLSCALSYLPWVVNTQNQKNRGPIGIWPIYKWYGGGYVSVSTTIKSGPIGI